MDVGKGVAGEIIGNAGNLGRLVADGVVDGLNRVLLVPAGLLHGALGRDLGLLHPNAGHPAVLADDCGRHPIEVHIETAVGRIALEVDAAVLSHVLGHLPDGEELLQHLPGQLVGTGPVDGLLIQVEVLLVDDDLHPGQLLQLAQLLDRELGLGWSATDEHVQFTGLVALNPLVDIVRDVGAQQVVGPPHQDSGDIHGHVPASDDGHLPGIQGPVLVSVGIAVIPFDEVGGPVNAIKLMPGNLQGAIVHSAGGEEHHIIALKQVIQVDVLAELHIRIEMDLGVVQRLLQGAGDVLDAGVVRGHAVTDQTEGDGQLLEQIDPGPVAQTQVCPLFPKLPQQDVRGVDPCRPRAYDGHAQG